jgi:lipoprotein NlpD
MWPASGKASPAVSVSGVKGLDIRGTRGQPVKAAAAGTVVYSGSGLRGYGELIIVKHDETFLSAYAHNESRLAHEGSRVSAGETIARMGDTDSRDVMLHFEIRRNGKAVDPLQYLPRR